MIINIHIKLSLEIKPVNEKNLLYLSNINCNKIFRIIFMIGHFNHILIINNNNCKRSSNINNSSRINNNLSKTYNNSYGLINIFKILISQQKDLQTSSKNNKYLHDF